MKYLKIFETTPEYNAFKLTENFVTPNVSLCEDAPTIIHYEPYVEDPYNGYDYVEIAGLKWATKNVGANSVTDTGLYFQWGDTQGYTTSQVGSGEGQKYFSWADYKYGNGTSSPGATGTTKYNSTDYLTTLDASDDAVQVNWGGDWRMPTEADFNALKAATTNAWVNNYGGSGVNGMLFTDKNDSSKMLFFPAAGYCASGSVYSVGMNSPYWSSSLSTSKVDKGREFSVEYSGCWMYDDNRERGFPIRGVIG